MQNWQPSPEDAAFNKAVQDYLLYLEQNVDEHIEWIKQHLLDFLDWLKTTLGPKG